MYHVRLLKSATRDLERLDRHVAVRIAQKISWLSKHIEEIELQPLSGDMEGFFKLRVGNYRVIYEVLWKERTIIIHAIGHRREIYRRR